VSSPGARSSSSHILSIHVLWRETHKVLRSRRCIACLQARHLVCMCVFACDRRLPLRQGARGWVYLERIKNRIEEVTLRRHRDPRQAHTALPMIVLCLPIRNCPSKWMLAVAALSNPAPQDVLFDLTTTQTVVQEDFEHAWERRTKASNGQVPRELRCESGTNPCLSHSLRGDCKYIYKSTCIFMYLHVCTYAFIHTYVYIHAYIYVHAYS